jgi:type IV pilus assembly protein PilY1
MSGERVLGKPTLLGGLVNHTTYVPNPDPCEGEGYSYLYSLYYATGTAWKENVFGDDEDMDVPVAYRRALGRGLTISPTLHLGSEEGARVFVQTSTGEIVEVHQPNLPIQNVHSGSGGWHTHDID